jgi:hypothetical protein
MSPEGSTEFNDEQESVQVHIKGDLMVQKDASLSGGHLDAVDARSAPMSSTPPRPRRASAMRDGDGQSSPYERVVGDASFTVTLKQLSRMVRKRELSRDLGMQTEVGKEEFVPSPLDERFDDAIATLEKLEDGEEAGATAERQVVLFSTIHQVRLRSLRERLADLARNLKRREPKLTMPYTSYSAFFAMTIVVQILLFCFVAYVSQVEAEQMYFSSCPGPLGIANPKSFFGRRPVRALLKHWGIIPDLGRLLLGDADLLSKSWPETIIWAFWRTVDHGPTSLTGRILLGRLAYTCGLFDINYIVVGNYVPS